MCRHGYFHVVNNDYTHWEMYANGGSANPTMNSQGNRYLAPTNHFAKEALVVKLREGTGPNANTGVVTGVLATVGKLARVGGFGMKQYLNYAGNC
ncbi:putative pectate lyase 14 [Magnolia sinica]|uniref:putative pectate lyase 14 n=1 Tax=Magnolia sinica TaxID=86752 RepID=UPI002658B55B|nr:putative pectate lyase 14 [Magnolia sinica]